MDIVPYDSTLHKEGVLRLLGNGGFKRQIMDWQFSHNQDFGPVVARSSDGAVRGFNGVMPVTLNIKGNLVKAAWSCDFIVSPECRRKGIGQELKAVLDEQWSVIMALGISPVGQKALGKAGWKKVRGPRRFLLRNRSVAKSESMARSQEPDFQAVADTVSAKSSHQLTIAISSHFPDDQSIDALLDSAISDYGVCVLRNSDYFRWRYKTSPDDSCFSLLIERSGTTLGLGVVQTTEESVVIVDYLGPRKNSAVKQMIVDAAIEMAGKTLFVECTTNDPELQQCLRLKGFRASLGSSVPFYVRSRLEDDTAALDDWFLMGGDSDGQILAGARSTWGQLSTQLLDEVEFRELGVEWDQLLSAADADPLFLSRHWQARWWQHFGQLNRLKLHAVAVRNTEDVLVALFPLFQRTTRMFGTTANRLELIGNIWQGAATMRSEYLEPIIDPDWIAPACEQLVKIVSQVPSLNDLALTDFPIDSAKSAPVVGALQRIGHTRKTIPDPRDEARYIVLPNRFSDYVGSLSRSTRLRLFGRRKKLHDLGNVRFRLVETNEIEGFFEALNKFHRTRWGAPVFQDERLDFHLDIAAFLSARGELRATQLILNDEILSVSYNLAAGNRVYNLQLGFDQEFCKGKLSLGLLHLGYDIEKAIDDGYDEFDLLAGAGRTSLYKNSITNRGTQLGTIHVVRSRWLRLIYALRDSLA